MYPLLHIDLDKIYHNARTLVERAGRYGIHIWGVTKVLGGEPRVAAAMMAAGVSAVADSRLENLAGLPQGPRVLLRLPSARRAEAVIAHAHWSLNSELVTIKALSEAAVAAGLVHKILLMVDLGDLREGLCPQQVLPLARRLKELPGIEIGGLGTNLTCYGGVLPDENNLSLLVRLAEQLRRRGLAACPVVSGGNSSSLPLLWEGRIPSGINNLRLGESIVLGRETIARRALPGLYTDAVQLEAEVIEVKIKPSLPVGAIGRDAFGARPVFVDQGERPRVILALGRQDIVPTGLIPVEAGLKVLGASSDHLILDSGDYPRPVQLGQIFRFNLNYAALLAATTSPYVRRHYYSQKF